MELTRVEGWARELNEVPCRAAGRLALGRGNLGPSGELTKSIRSRQAEWHREPHLTAKVRGLVSSSLKLCLVLVCRRKRRVW